ncbi:DUF2061 domain-containing protein [bacterium]|nr:DUF2061 domain-containing protein [bacterium]
MIIREDSHTLSLIKGILYRFFGTICTILISFVFTKNVTISLSIGIVEIISKVLLYYVYERLWIFSMKKIYKKESANG